MLKKSLTAVTLVLALVGYVQADDAGGGGVQQLEFATFDPIGSAPERNSILSCSEVRAHAWLDHERERSDGDVLPVMQAVACEDGYLAAVTTDID